MTAAFEFRPSGCDVTAAFEFHSGRCDMMATLNFRSGRFDVTVLSGRQNNARHSGTDRVACR